ncbi:helix-turn-helix domain-containing protein [Novosphingobium tardum]|uniref:Helix-turn-helix domain-containing protein n=1 Tax=Novosphingobium tardum TaxID=1538021 RepID=A0ABV8RKQ1_9SPHN
MASPARREERLREGRLTSLALIKLDYIAPPPDLAPFVITFYLFRCDESEIHDIQPGTGCNLSIFMRGKGEMAFRDGMIDASHPINVLTPCAVAAPFMVDGPWHAFGAALSPLGWAALTGKSAAKEGNRLRNATELLGADFAAAGERIIAGYNAGALDGGGMEAILSDAIRRNIGPVPSSHVRLIQMVAQWLGSSLSPSVDDLNAMANYSPRQVQRLVDYYYGLPPKQLARKYRALRAASLLAEPGITADDADAIAGHFYDQSHMIREIRLFAGRTPARVGEADSPVLGALLNLRNFREIRPQVAPLPDDLHR